ncbi:m-phase inducer phosphatase [Sorochytrium milnesiophthora]
MFSETDALSSPCNVFQVTPMTTLAVGLGMNLMLKQQSPATSNVRKNLFCRFTSKSPMAIRSDPGDQAAVISSDNAPEDDDDEDDLSLSIQATPLVKVEHKQSRAPPAPKPLAPSLRSFDFLAPAPAAPGSRPELLRSKSQVMLKRDASAAFITGPPRIVGAKGRQIAHWSSKPSSPAAVSAVFGKRNLISMPASRSLQDSPSSTAGRQVDDMLISPEMPARKRNCLRATVSDSQLMPVSDQLSSQQCFIPKPPAPLRLPSFDESQPSLPTKPGVIPLVTASTVADLLKGKFGKRTYYIIDCRFPYEYEGGHIRSALNVNSYEQLHNIFLKSHERIGKDVIIIFHCEFSSQRAPQMAQDLRNKDRKFNEHNYPSLFYPELYVLEGGYKDFFLTHKEHCTPQEYVTMHDRGYIKECRQQLATRKISLERSRSYSDAESLRAELARRKSITLQTGGLLSFRSVPSILAVPTSLDIAPSAVEEATPTCMEL